MQQNDSFWHDFSGILCARPQVHKTPRIPRILLIWCPCCDRELFARRHSMCGTVFFKYHVVNSHKKAPKPIKSKSSGSDPTWKWHVTRFFKSFGPRPPFFRPRDPDPPPHSKFVYVGNIWNPRSRFGIQPVQCLVLVLAIPEQHGIALIQAAAYSFGNTTPWPNEFRNT